MCNVVYEDNHLLVVEKPSNLLAQGDATGDDCLVERMKRYIGEKYQKPGAVYLGLVHRMDRPVGGLVVLARTSKAAARLSEQLRSHQMQREYVAVVHGSDVPSESTLRDILVKDAATGKVWVQDEKTDATGDGQGGAHSADCGDVNQRNAVQERGQDATLHYRVLTRDAAKDTALLHIRLETGRKHQIRVQLAHAGYPIVQDMRYGKDAPGEPIALWGAVLRLAHPTRKETMTFVSKPKGKMFTEFDNEIELLLEQATKTEGCGDLRETVDR